jgi:hypothetical protein
MPPISKAITFRTSIFLSNFMPYSLRYVFIYLSIMLLCYVPTNSDYATIFTLNITFNKREHNSTYSSCIFEYAF